MEIDLYSYYQMFKGRLWIIALCIILFTVPAALLSEEPYEPVYQATTELYLEYVTMTQSLHVDYSAIRIYLESPIMMNEVIEKHPELPYTAEQLSRIVNTTEINGSRVLRITAQDHNYEYAVQIVSAVTDTFQEEKPAWLNVENIIVLNPAQLIDNPQPINERSNRQMQMTVLALIVSIVFSIGIILLLDMLDDTLKSAKDVQEIFDKPTWAVIPKMRRREYTIKKNAMEKSSVAAKEGIYATKNE